MKEVTKKIGLRQSTLFRMINLGTFPKLFELVPGCPAWLESDVNAWLTGKAQRCAVSSERTDKRGTRADRRPSSKDRLTQHALWDLAELHRSEQHTRQWTIT
ncbi:helix-turn-helix transcriptional regulator [Burkholderia sola]